MISLEEAVSMILPKELQKNLEIKDGGVRRLSPDNVPATPRITLRRAPFCMTNNSYEAANQNEGL